MKIAFLGWGSLLRISHALKLVGKWQSDGPLFPLEFAYITKSNVLTLAIHPASSQVQTFWAQSEFEDLEEAKGALGKLSRTELSDISCSSAEENSNKDELAAATYDSLRVWLKQKGLDAVVWIGRKSNFKEATGADFTEESAMDFINMLSKNQRLAAEEHIINYPDQIETTLRQQLRIKFGWRNLSEYKKGFWLDKNTFVVADAIDMIEGRRKAPGDPHENIETVPMLLMKNVTQMIVNNDGKILGEDRMANLALWLDDVKRLYKEQELWHKDK
jgi:hypothetical protein